MEQQLFTWDIPPEKREHLRNLVRETFITARPFPTVTRWYHPITGGLLKLFDKGGQLLGRKRARNKHAHSAGESL